MRWRMRLASDRADKNACGCAMEYGVPTLSRKYTKWRRTVPCAATGAAANTFNRPATRPKINHFVVEGTIVNGKCEVKKRRPV